MKDADYGEFFTQKIPEPKANPSSAKRSRPMKTAKTKLDELEIVLMRQRKSKHLLI